MQSTLTATVYATVITNQGLTCREINKIIGGNPSTAKALFQLTKRGALTAMPGKGSRSTLYFKGNAPVKLNQGQGFHQKTIDREAEIASLKLTVQQAIEMLSNTQKVLNKM